MTATVDLRARVQHLDHPAVGEVLSNDVLTLLVGLHDRFEEPCTQLRAQHALADTRCDRPAYDPETAYIRANEWHVAPAPRDLVDRRTELVGQVSRHALIEGMTSGAQVYMADFEDTIMPRWDIIIDGQRNLRDAYRGDLSAEFEDEIRQPGDDAATLMIRTRGWHLDEPSFLIDGTPIAAPLFDFGVCVANNAAAALANGTGPYFYLPKLRGQADARLWSEVLTWTEHQLGLSSGSIRVSALIETIHAAFAMDEILFERVTTSPGSMQATGITSSASSRRFPTTPTWSSLMWLCSGRRPRSSGHSPSSSSPPVTAAVPTPSAACPG